MNCPCGGNTVQAENRRGPALLSYEKCGSCGRCGGFILRVDGEIVDRGEPARLMFLGETA